MVTIGIGLLLSNSAMYEHICLENINKLYTSAVNYDNQQQYKDTIEAAMFSTPEIFTDNIPMSPGPSVNVRKSSAIKSIRLFTEFLDVKNKTAVQRVGADKSKRKLVISGSILWSSIPKSRRHKKINEQVKKSLYNWIIQHPQVVQSPISDYCLKFSIDDHSEPHLVPKLLPQVSVR